MVSGVERNTLALALYRQCHFKQEGNKVRKQKKDIEAELEQLRAAIDMLRPVIVQLQIDVHTLKSQQYLKDWSINGK